jgi:hypothetical protein
MATILKAIQYKNLDEARAVIRAKIGVLPEGDLFADSGDEPQGLLSIIAEDMLSDEDFHRLLDEKRGTLIEVERIEYSGFGPPADDEHYMGFVSREHAYVVKGCRHPIEIFDCPCNARDIHHLEAMVLDAEHPLNEEDLALRLELPNDWDFDRLFELIVEGQITAEEIDKLIHMGIQ